jgi:hypothetical protein
VSTQIFNDADSDVLLFQVPFRKQRKKVGAFLKKKLLSVEPRFESKQSKGSKQAKRAHGMARRRGQWGKNVASVCVPCVCVRVL